MSSNTFSVTITFNEAPFRKPRTVLYNFWDEINSCLKCLNKNDEKCTVAQYCVTDIKSNCKSFQLSIKTHHECQIIRENKFSVV